MEGNLSKQSKVLPMLMDSSVTYVFACILPILLTGKEGRRCTIDHPTGRELSRFASGPDRSSIVIVYIRLELQ